MLRSWGKREDQELPVVLIVVLRCVDGGIVCFVVVVSVVS